MQHWKHTEWFSNWTLLWPVRKGICKSLRERNKDRHRERNELKHKIPRMPCLVILPTINTLWKELVLMHGREVALWLLPFCRTTPHWSLTEKGTGLNSWADALLKEKIILRQTVKYYRDCNVITTELSPCWILLQISKSTKGYRSCPQD